MTALRMRDYKSFRESSVVPLRRLSVLLGKNNSGKTAAARLPLLILAAASAGPAQRAPIPLRVHGITFASNALELVHGQLPHGSFSLGYSYIDDLGEVIDIDFTIQLIQDITAGASSFVSEFRATSVDDAVSWSRGPSSLEKIRYGDLVSGFEGIFPQFRSESRQHAVDSLRHQADTSARGLLHLISTRAPLLPVYEKRPADVSTDVNGSEVPYLLNEYPDLMQLTSEWYAQELGIEGIRLDAEASAFRLGGGAPRGPSHNLARVGQGVQQVLPIVGYLRAIESGHLEKNLVVLEEPELHLHPSAHGALSNLAVSAVRARPNLQILVETHSENLILRLRQKVASGALPPEQINLLWFEQAGDETLVREILIKDDGSVTDWPTGVFAEDLAEVRAIARAARR